MLDLYVQYPNSLNSFVTNFLGKHRTTVLFVVQSFHANGKRKKEARRRIGTQRRKDVEFFSHSTITLSASLRLCVRIRALCLCMKFNHFRKS